MEFVREAAQQNVDPDYVKMVGGVNHELMGKADMDKYSLDELIVIFENHAILNAEQIEKNKAMFPDSEWAKDDFNISKALHSICCEIEVLKNGQNTR